MASDVSRLLDLKSAYDDAITIYQDVMREIISVIAQVEPEDLRETLYLRYVEFLPWSAIQTIGGYSSEWKMYDCHRRALDIVEDIIKGLP